MQLNRVMMAFIMIAVGVPGAVRAEAGKEALEDEDGFLDPVIESKNPPAPNVGQKMPSSSPESQELQNNRMKTLEGSRSRWSGQFNLTYSGSSIAHPFSGEVPNPGNQVPPPLVTFSGTVSARGRIDDKTTLGLGTGILTQTPFQGPKNTSVADPYMDLAHSFNLGPIHNRADFQSTLWTNNQYYDVFGYRFGFTLLNESFYQFKFGLTVGFVLQIDYNIFADGSQYDSSQQTQYDLYTDPYFEYKLSKRLNVRSVVGIASLHNRNLNGTFAFYHPDVYQTFGLGISCTDSVYIYPYILLFPISGNITSQSTLVGFNAIINLF